MPKIKPKNVKYLTLIKRHVTIVKNKQQINTKTNETDVNKTIQERIIVQLFCNNRKIWVNPNTETVKNIQKLIKGCNCA